MHDILNADELREMTDYISELPDNTNGRELTEYAAKLCREINAGKCTNSPGIE